jgi:hypothetical protein
MKNLLTFVAVIAFSLSLAAPNRYVRLDNASGYTSGACLDEWALGTLPIEARRNDPSYMFIRGREQLVIEKLGDSWSYRNEKKRFYPTNNEIIFTRSGNKISGIDRESYPAFYLTCKGLAEIFSTHIPDFNWDGACN